MKPYVYGSRSFPYSHASQGWPLVFNKHCSWSPFTQLYEVQHLPHISNCCVPSLFEGTSLSLLHIICLLFKYIIWKLRPQLSDGSRKVANLLITWLFVLWQGWEWSLSSFFPPKWKPEAPRFPFSYHWLSLLFIAKSHKGIVYSHCLQFLSPTFMFLALPHMKICKL